MRARLAIALVGLLAGSALVLPASSNAQALPLFDLDTVLEIANVELPPPGIGVQIHADFPADAPLTVDGVGYHSVTLDITPARGVVTRNAVAAEGDSGGSGGDGSNQECDDQAYKETGVSWKDGTMPILWRLDRASIPDHLRVDRTRASLRSAHRVWPRSHSNCTTEDKIDVSYNYIGHTGKDPTYDKTNIIDFGEVGSRALAVNYTWYVGGDIIEVDLRLNRDYTWTNVDGVNFYQVRNVVAHELGHQLGLDDLGDPHERLTMYALIGRGELSKATLGIGDLRGAWKVQP